MAGLEKLKKEDNGAMAVYDTNNMDTPLLEQDFSITATPSSTNNTDSWTFLVNHPSISRSPTIATRSNQEPLRRSLRSRIPRREWAAMLTADHQDDPDEPYEPDQYRDAICFPDANKWKTGMVDEYESLMKNYTWILTSLTHGRRAIKGRWTFKYKPATNGEDPRYKASFVACGYSQRLGIDYNEAYAAVVSHDTFRILMSTVAALDLKWCHPKATPAEPNMHLTLQ
ncbi:hypothetical protein GHT06_009942 [Daphnia sinensis]|uniref:Reverse transcriptase Ty1/copia-type domain-containing protein n=1 Tax=Daphnia sinensis TaxID=1820382 RepID=A0AAD5LR95_9CRUS|nr:hypothetical protein GHT06_009942 [Daphnia sinensis]